MKRCTKCSTKLPLTEFVKRLSSPDGLSYWCKNCHREFYRKWYKVHRKENNKAGQEYRKAHKKEISEYNKLHRAEKIKRCHKYYQEHKTKMIEQGRKHRQLYPEKNRALCQQRRARKRNGSIEKFLDTEIFERDDWVCGVCGRKINRRLKYPHPYSKSLDHIVPLSRGGSHTRVNVRIAHLRCNVSKNAGNGGQLRLIG